MKNIIPFLAVILMIFMTSCGADKTPDYVPATGEEPATVAQPIETQTAPATIDPAITNTMAPASATPAPSGTTANADDGPVNPAHGQPNHRCDISVGAPLSSPPNPQGVSTPALPGPGDPPVTERLQMPANNTPPPSNPVGSNGKPVPAAPGMNPAHGEPGHDCAVAVGAPLKK